MKNKDLKFLKFLMEVAAESVSEWIEEMSTEEVETTMREASEEGSEGIAELLFEEWKRRS